VWLCGALAEIGPYGSTSVAELAGWLSHMQTYGDEWPWLFAGAIDAGGTEGGKTLETLIDCVNGVHPVGGVSAQVIRSLLCSSSPRAWEAVEKLLLAAQRQEGVRQFILESVHHAHPGAFRRMCRVILDHSLCRFSSVVRAADVWFGLLWDSASPRVVEEAIESALGFLDDPSQRSVAVPRGKPEEAYFALWAAAFDDSNAALPLVQRALASQNPVTRYAAVHVAARIHTDEAKALLLHAVADKDLRVAARASDVFLSEWFSDEAPPKPELKRRAAVFAALESLLARFPGKTAKLDPALWPWTGREIHAAKIAEGMARHLTEDTAERLLPHIDRLGAMERQFLADRLGGPTGHARWRSTWPADGVKPRQISEAARRGLVLLAADPSGKVVGASMRALWNRPIGDDELAAISTVLQRTSAEARSSVLKRLGQLPDRRLIGFATQLLGGVAAQRSAGLEVLKTMVESKRSPAQARDTARSWRDTSKGLSDDDRAALGMILDVGTERPRRDNAFGLVNGSNLTRPAVTRSLPRLTMSDAAWLCLASLATLIARNKDRELPRAPDSGLKEPLLLGGDGFGWDVPRPQPGRTLDDERARCPVAELIHPWLDQRDSRMCDADRMELLRAQIALDAFGIETAKWTGDFRLQWPKTIEKQLNRECPDALKVLNRPIEYILNWAMRFTGDPGYATVLLDSAEGALARGYFAKLARRGADTPQDAKGALLATPADWLKVLASLQELGIVEETRQAAARIWRLAVAARPEATKRWAAIPETVREDSWRGTAAGIAIDPSSDQLIEALLAGAATEDDLLDFSTHPYWCVDHGQVSWLTGSPLLDESEETPAPHKQRRVGLVCAARANPAFVSAGNRLRERIIALEIGRGDTPTEASAMARNVAFAGGAEVCIRCLAALGDRALKRSGRWSDESRQASLTHFVSVTLPGDGDTPARFSTLAREAGLADETLITLAVFTPQWVQHVESALGTEWEGFEEAVWWIHAHTRDSEYRVESAIRAKWQAAIAERTPITPDDLRDGAVDVAWFARVQETLGPKRWAQVYEAAKFACGGAGHKRAQLFADAMTGKITEQELTTRINSKRHQDSILALGLLPLAAGDKGHKQVLARYKVMQEVRRTSRKHGGSMLQASEKRAVEIGMENLARTAGFPDPLRLQWAMERLDLADLAKGPVSAKAGEVTVTLSINVDGTPEIVAEKKGKPLASIPASAKKDAGIAALTQRNTELRRSGSRMRHALEQAICRGDRFTAGELVTLREHPILWSMLSRLVLVADGKPSLAGYPDRDGHALRDHAGHLEPLRASDELRLAHPHDLLGRKDWSAWQRECYASERVQPFKQVFRELYVPSVSELGAAAVESTRYEGQQVQPRQALALLGGRTWTARADEGVQRTFHKERITARLGFAESFYTPAEVEGLTLRALRFTPAGKLDAIKLANVPPRVFSETMRDLDLVVSVAHRGGVDPEASQSTVEMRAALLRETMTLLKLTNVTVEGQRARIRGSLAEYSVHLGSAGVHVMPGGHVWIVPVGAQHRGRLFLPFADDDPKTAEVISKILLLARDSEIMDPFILDQIRSFA
jgi:hypothetical protein